MTHKRETEACGTNSFEGSLKFALIGGMFCRCQDISAIPMQCQSPEASRDLTFEMDVGRLHGVVLLMVVIEAFPHTRVIA